MRKFRGRSIHGTIAVVLLAGAIGTLGLVPETVAEASPATGSPLVFGVMGTDTGPDAIPQEGQAFQAYVNQWNAEGGYKGHRIKLISIDGQLNPTITAAAARTLVDQDNVIAIVHDYNLLDCPVNNSFYQQSDIALLGGGTGCYVPGTDFPEYRTPGTMGLAVLAQFGFDHGAKKVALQAPSLLAPLVPTLQGYVKTTKGQLVVPPFTPETPTVADFDAFIASAKSAGATAVIGLLEPAEAQLFLQEATRQSFGPSNGIKFLFTPVEYDPRVAAEFNGAYVYTYGYPWTSKNPEAVAAYKLLKGKVSVLDGFAQQGYQFAGEFRQVLNLVKGPVTRASFLAAAKRATSISVPLTPMKIDLVDPSKDPEGGSFVKAVNGRFVAVGGFVEARF